MVGSKTGINMIINSEKTIDVITSWIKDRLYKFGDRSAIIFYDGSAESIINILLCKLSHVETYCIIPHLHSTNDSFKENDKHLLSKLAKTLILEDNCSLNSLNKMAPITEDVLYIINNCFKQNERIRELIQINNCSGHLLEIEDDLDSRIYFVMLSYIASILKGAIIGNLNRIEYSLIRNFTKFGNKTGDILPVAELNRTEILNLIQFIITKYEISIPKYNKQDEILVNGTNITYDELEYLERENHINKILSNESDPTKHRDWARYNTRQRQLICLIHQREKKTRHKIGAVEICSILNNKSLVSI